jgi:8-oxo-dGTP pyrophosphatase MutT (NUDIX family)
MHFIDFKSYLLKINDYELPGHDYLLKISPPARIKHLKKNFIPKDSKTASVLMLFYPDNNNETRLVLMLRNKYKGVHSNQISLPGGKVDRLDKSLKDTALRETYEEIGLHRDDIEIVGELSSVYIPPSNFNVFPFIGYSSKTPKFFPDSKEVSLILSPKLSYILGMEIVESVVEVNNSKQKVPSFLIDNHILWGATAIMIHEFVLLFKQMVNS